MPNTFIGAEKEIVKLVSDFWSGTGYAIKLPNGKDVMGVDEPGLKLDVLHDGGGNGAIGNKRFERTGQVWCRMYFTQGNMSGIGDMVEGVAGLFEGQATQKGTWFRNVRIVTVGDEIGMYRIDVRADFEYDRIRS